MIISGIHGLLLGALLFLPAMLSALGPGIEWLRVGKKRVSTETPRFWSWVATTVLRAPVLVTILVSCLLVVLGLPFLRIQAAVSGAARGTRPCLSRISGT